MPQPAAAHYLDAEAQDRVGEEELRDGAEVSSALLLVLQKLHHVQDLEAEHQKHPATTQVAGALAADCQVWSESSTTKSNTSLPLVPRSSSHTTSQNATHSLPEPGKALWIQVAKCMLGSVVRTSCPSLLQRYPSRYLSPTIMGSRSGYNMFHFCQLPMQHPH